MSTIHRTSPMANYQNGQSQVVVLIVPFPSQGHLNQLLHLSRLVSAYNIPVHYVSATTHNRQAKLRVHGWNPLSITNLHFHEFQAPHFLSPPPSPNSTLKFPSHLQSSFDASLHLREPVASLIRKISLTTKRVIVIHDSLMSFVVQDVTSVPNAESYTFHSVSAFALFFYFWEIAGKPSHVDSEIVKDLPSIYDSFSSQFLEFISTQHNYIKFSSGIIYNTNKAIEAPYIDLLAMEHLKGRRKQWALGPFNHIATYDNKNTNLRHKCLEWLDKQPPNSVIYVCFGTTTSLSDEQIKELALGLEKSNQKFIWVLRDADKGDVFVGEEMRAELPKGYEERVRGKGIVVREWVPQLDILENSSTGGFMSHCGWNSCMESITMGVPIVAWPMHSDQPRNAMLVTKLLKIGVVVKDWACGNKLVTALAIEMAVKRLMGTKEGDEMRERAAELGGTVQRSVEEGGTARLEWDSFITHITR